MFFLDKLFIKWVIAKCTELGGVFMLGPGEGAMIYLGIICLGLVKALESKEGKKK